MIPFLPSRHTLGLAERIRFPDPSTATPEGILCAGGNLSPGFLLSAYSQGIFPWFGPGEPIIWWSPDPRFVVLPESFHVSRSTKRLMRSRAYSITADTAFRRVIALCSAIPRKGQDGTWITEDMITAYERLHELGYAHSVECWEGERLAGGLYGVSLGKAFFGESMFSEDSGASRVAFVIFAQALFERGWRLIDSQVHTPYVQSMGGISISRSSYLRRLETALEDEEAPGSWKGWLDARCDSWRDAL